MLIYFVEMLASLNVLGPTDRLKQGNPPAPPASATREFLGKPRVLRPHHSDGLLTGSGQVGGGDRGRAWHVIKPSLAVLYWRL